MSGQPFLEIDPLLQVSVATLVKRVVEMLMVKEVMKETNEINSDDLKKMKDEIAIVKNYIKKCRGAAELYREMDWTTEEMVEVKTDDIPFSN